MWHQRRMCKSCNNEKLSPLLLPKSNINNGELFSPLQLDCVPQWWEWNVTTERELLTCLWSVAEWGWLVAGYCTAMRPEIEHPAVLQYLIEQARIRSDPWVWRHILQYLREQAQMCSNPRVWHHFLAKLHWDSLFWTWGRTDGQTDGRNYLQAMS